MDKTISAIEQFLEFGEQSFCKCKDPVSCNLKGHHGYFSGGGWAATELRKHVAAMQEARDERTEE